MKKFWGIFLFIFLMFNQASAVNMVNKENYLKYPISIVGLPDFPPFSQYVSGKDSNMQLHSAFYRPILDAMAKYGFKISPAEIEKSEANDVKLLVLKVSSGEAQIFIGAYADTKMFSGLQMIYPASLSNPIHLITMPDTNDKIKSYGDLKNLKGIVCKKEYFSDFVLRKFRDLNIDYVKTPYEAYEQIITGKADYMLGSLYYNRMVASRYGVEQYFSYSKNPVFKIPFFIAISKMTPLFSEYMKVFNAEFSKPEFANAVKNEIIRIVEEEVEKNIGIVPPSFVHRSTAVAAEETNPDNSASPTTKSHIVEQEVREKGIDEVLDGI